MTCISFHSQRTIFLSTRQPHLTGPIINPQKTGRGKRAEGPKNSVTDIWIQWITGFRWIFFHIFILRLKIAISGSRNICQKAQCLLSWPMFPLITVDSLLPAHWPFFNKAHGWFQSITDQTMNNNAEPTGFDYCDVTEEKMKSSKRTNAPRLLLLSSLVY